MRVNGTLMSTRPPPPQRLEVWRLWTGIQAAEMRRCPRSARPVDRSTVDSNSSLVSSWALVSTSGAFDKNTDKFRLETHHLTKI